MEQRRRDCRPKWGTDGAIASQNLTAEQVAVITLIGANITTVLDFAFGLNSRTFKTTLTFVKRVTTELSAV